jgi:transcription termination factor Rho
MNSKLRVIILLIDERPEEVTSFVLNTNAPVFHSSLDKGTSSHVLLSGFLINHLIAEMECGNDTVILLDSLTRMGRAYNAGKNNNRTMSGGLSSGALEIPRKLFGLARNIQNGGSCTILATILKDTGSRMDEVIFQEFKGTGNCEIILDREIAEERLYPALHLSESGTRKDELLHSEEEIIKINKLRRSLLQMDKFSALVKFIEMVESTESNTELLNQL